MKDRNGIHCCEEVARIDASGDIMIRRFEGVYYAGNVTRADAVRVLKEHAAKLLTAYEMQGDIILAVVLKGRKDGTIDAKTAATLAGKAVFCYRMAGYAKFYLTGELKP